MKKILILFLTVSMAFSAVYAEEETVGNLKKEIKLINEKLDMINTNYDLTVKFGGNFDITQDWESGGGADVLEYKGDLYMTSQVNQDMRTLTKFSIEEGEDVEVEELEFTLSSSYGKVNIFKKDSYDEEKAPASFSDPLNLFVADSVEPTEGIIFSGKYPRSFYNGNLRYRTMFYNTDSGEFIGLQSGYSVKNKNLGKITLRGNYVEKVSSYYYDRDESGDIINETKDRYNKNMGLDLSYAKRFGRLMNVSAEFEIVDSEGKEVKTDDFSKTSTIYGKLNTKFFNDHLISDFGYYSSGSDYYSVAGDSSVRVFSYSDDILMGSDKEVVMGYTKLLLGRKIEISALYMSEDTQNEDDEPYIIMEGELKVKMLKGLELGLRASYEQEEWYLAENVDEDYKITGEQEEGEYTYTPNITIKPSNGVKIYAENAIIIDKDDLMGKKEIVDGKMQRVDNDEEISNIAILRLELASDKVTMENELEMDFGPMSDYEGDKDIDIKNISEFAYYITDTTVFKIYNEFRYKDKNKDKLENGDNIVIVENISEDGISNSLNGVITRTVNKSEFSLLAGFGWEELYKDDGDSKKNSNMGMNFGMMYKYNYNSSTEFKISLLSAGIMSVDDEEYEHTGYGNYGNGEDFIELSDESIENGTSVKIELSTKF